MGRYNTPSHRTQPPVAQASSPLRTTRPSGAIPDTRTYEGAPGWSRDAKTDLFLRSTSSFGGGEKSFYETGEQRDETLRQLVRQVSTMDFPWLCQFAEWLRTKGNIRTAALTIAADAVKMRLDDHKVFGVSQSATYTNRWLINAVCQRADEPGELLADWLATYGRNIPKPVKRGLADACRRLYNERSMLKYDTSSHAIRFADVLELCHVTPNELVSVQRWETDFSTGVYCPHPEKIRRHSSHIPNGLLEMVPKLRSYLCQCGWYHFTSSPQRTESPSSVERVKTRRFIASGGWQSELFKHAVDRRHGHGNEVPESLTTIHASASFRTRATDAPHLVYDPDALREAGMTWEDALSLSGTIGVEKRKVWKAMLPTMGYMALLRNLRNFDEAKIGDVSSQFVIAKLTAPQEVARSHQLPFRFYSAYKNVTSLRWGHALETALDLSLTNIPQLDGSTLVLVDTSGSMTNAMSDKSTLMCVEAAAVFGAALALKNAGNADLYQYASQTAKIDIPRGGSTLRLVEHIMGRVNEVGWGTHIHSAINTTYAGHDRAVILTDAQGCDGQSAEGVADRVPRHVPVYLFNLQSHSVSPMPTGGAARYDLGGLTDATFALIPRMESGVSGAWPWELEAA